MLFVSAVVVFCAAGPVHRCSETTAEGKVQFSVQRHSPHGRRRCGKKVVISFLFSCVLIVKLKQSERETNIVISPTSIVTRSYLLCIVSVDIDFSRFVYRVCVFFVRTPLSCFQDQEQKTELSTGERCAASNNLQTEESFSQS